LTREVKIVPRHRNLVGSRTNIQECRTDLIIDLPREIGKFVLALLQSRLRADHIPSDTPAVKQIDLRRSHKTKRAMRVIERRANVAVIGRDAGGRITLAPRRLDIVLRFGNPASARAPPAAPAPGSLPSRERTARFPTD
jgi:hypothetical protein